MEHGIITSVKYKDGAVLCDVQAVRVATQYDNVPVMKSFAGTHEMPQPRQKAVMETLDDGTKFILGVLGREEARPAEMQPGEYSVQLDDGTELSFTERSDGAYDLTVSASGDLTVNADGDVAIDGIDFDEHVHEHDDATISDTSDGTGSKSTETKQTGPPQ